MSNRRERIEKLIEEAKELVEEIANEAYAEVQAVEREAEQNIERHKDASAELDSLKARVRSLRDERERLPVEHSRALLDDNYAEELRIKERANTIREELAEAESRIEELETEIETLSPPHNPRWPSHANDVEIHHYYGVKKVLAGALSDLQRAANGLSSAASKHLGAFEAKREELYGITYGLEEERSWDPEQREALRGAGGSPGQSRVKVNRADPERLAEKGVTL